MTSIAIYAGTFCYFVAALGFAIEKHNFYTSACFVLYGLCNILIMWGSRQ